MSLLGDLASIGLANIFIAPPGWGVQPPVETEAQAFEAWLDRARPSGDVTDVHDQWLMSVDRYEWLERRGPREQLNESRSSASATIDALLLLAPLA